MTDQLKIGQEVLIHGYVDEIRKDTVIIRNEGGYFGTVEYEITDIEMPNTNEVLDKIRAEMEQIKEAEYQIYGKGSWKFVDKCLDIIDKYKAEGSDKE